MTLLTTSSSERTPASKCSVSILLLPAFTAISADFCSELLALCEK